MSRRIGLRRARSLRSIFVFYLEIPRLSIVIRLLPPVLSLSLSFSLFLPVVHCVCLTFLYLSTLTILPPDLLLKKGASWCSQLQIANLLKWHYDVKRLSAIIV